MSKTLVIILSETRASELTFENFKKNVIDELNADLCVCIGVKPDYDYENPFYKLAKYHFTYDEPDDFADAFNYAYDILKTENIYEKLENINTLYGKVQQPKKSTDTITYYGDVDNCKKELIDDAEIIVHSKNFGDKCFCGDVYGVKKSNNDTFVKQENVTTFKKPLHWREFLKIKDQFLGGIKDPDEQHSGSAGILIFFRWFLLEKLYKTNLINEYDRFVITRSDYIYRLPHPKVEMMDPRFIWIPDSENYGGYTDRHVVLSREHVTPYLNILNNFVTRSNEYFMKMKECNSWNLEKVIKFHLEQNNVLDCVKEFPYVMYSVRNVSGSSRWALGDFDKTLGYYIKYKSEYNKSNDYLTQFNASNLDIQAYYLSIFNSKNRTR